MAMVPDGHRHRLLPEERLRSSRIRPAPAQRRQRHAALRRQPYRSLQSLVRAAKLPLEIRRVEGSQREHELCVAGGRSECPTDRTRVVDVQHERQVGLLSKRQGRAVLGQFVRIGRYSMVGGCSKVVQDVPPFMMVDGNPGETRFVNKVGLERGGFSEDAIATLTKAYKILFRSGLTTAKALERIEAELDPTPEIRHLAEFARASQRGLTK